MKYLSNHNEPLSRTLNDLILKAFADTFLQPLASVSVQFVNYEPYDNFEQMNNDMVFFGRLKISTLHCENTIFGNPVINQMFRAVHDVLHQVYKLDFSHESELMVNYYQNQIFKKLGASQFDLDLLNIETAGQIVYHKKHNDFPKDQRLFAFTELKAMGY